MTNVIHHHIGGKKFSSASDRFADVFNPATGETACRVSLASGAEVTGAIDTAAAAFPDWAATPPLRRARVMFKFKELLDKNHEALAKLITQEHGKTLPDAYGEVTRGLEVVEFACGIPHLQKGEFSENVGTNVDSYSMRQPLGVCAGITPFNFPVMVPMWMYPMAIACGNSFVLKPSEKAPSASLLIAELLAEAGLPDGVFNVVNGDKEAVDVLLTDARVAAVSFVGSTPIAEYIYQTGSAHGKRVQALGGAKNHMIVMPDADMDQAADALMGAAFGSAGERCMAISVAVTVGDAGDRLLDRLMPKIQALKVAPGMDPEAEMGPLVTADHLARVRSYIDLGIEEGADLKIDGRGLKLQGYEDGFFLGPCLFDNVETDMTIYKEEIFGPVLSVVRRDDFDGALKIIDDHEFGNGTAIFTRDGDAARNFANRVQVGMVGINVPIPVPMSFHSFGGWKRSIFGSHGMHGTEGVHFYTALKTMTVRWPTGIRAGAEFVMPTMK